MTVGRSVALARAFRREQEDPDHFYEIAARDVVAQVSRFVDLDRSLVVDVGTGPSQFGEAFSLAGAHFVGVDLTEAGNGVVASGDRLPFRSESVDVAFCSNVLEHFRHPWAIADELVRVCRPTGAVIISFTVWRSPWGGHETSPWHYLGGAWAARRYTSRHGRAPKNLYGETLFRVGVGDALRWAGSLPDAALVHAAPRYYPNWLGWLTRVPLLRELVTWNLFLVVRKWRKGPLLDESH